MPSHQSPNDELPRLREHMANERTYLAWVRTSIGIMAFGFVVEKFSLFLKQITAFLKNEHIPQSAYTSPLFQGYSSIFGILLVVFGALICLFAFIKYKKIEKQIKAVTYYPNTLLDSTLTLCVFLIAIVLAIYLISSL
jgi:uncharacterized membrane protein YidH (DUF202 family)